MTDGSTRYFISWIVMKARSEPRDIKEGELSNGIGNRRDILQLLYSWLH